MVELVLVRHGQSNLQNIIEGQLNGKLSNQGIRQSILTGQHLQNENFDCAIVSDLERASQTFDIINNQLKNPIQKIEYSKILREKSGGILEGQKISFCKALTIQSGVEIREFKAENGESWVDVFDRSNIFLNQIIDSKLNLKKILIVTHGGFIMEFFNQIKYQYYNQQPVFENIGPNCSISKILIFNKKKNQDVKIIQKNQISHLNSLD